MTGALWLVLALAVWGFLHSWLASHGVKKALERRLGTFFRFYRLFYNLFAVVSFFPVLALMALLPDRMLYAWPAPWAYLALIGQGVALILLAVALFQTDLWDFLGLRFSNTPPRLVESGFYRYMRHPLYTFGLLFIWLTPRMSLNQLILFLGLTVYILIGAWFEERKLLREFGQAYAEYRARTPMFLPFRRVRR